MHRVHLPLSFECDLDVHARPGEQTAHIHCSTCDKNVHQLSNMTQREAKALLAGKPDGGLCIAYRCDLNGKVSFLHRCEDRHNTPLTASELATVRAPRPPIVLALSVAVALLSACAAHGVVPESEVREVQAPIPNPLLASLAFNKNKSIY